MQIMSHTNAFLSPLLLELDFLKIFFVMFNADRPRLYIHENRVIQVSSVCQYSTVSVCVMCVCVCVCEKKLSCSSEAETLAIHSMLKNSSEVTLVDHTICHIVEPRVLPLI